MGVVALPGDDVDADVAADLQRRGVGDVAGQRVLPEDVARELVAEVVAEPALVRVVPVATVEVEGDPTDAREERLIPGVSVVARYREGSLLVRRRVGVAEPREALERKFVVRAFGFLETNDIRPDGLEEFRHQIDAQPHRVDVPGCDRQCHAE